MSFEINFSTRWADFDANVHMRHTAYNDYCAEARLRYFKQFGITVKDFEQAKIGPILFEENTKFFKEIRLGEDISIKIKLLALSTQGERWKLQSEVYNEAKELAATIIVFGAWLHLEHRKLIVPPKKFQTIFNRLEKTENFQEIVLKKKNEKK